MPEKSRDGKSEFLGCCLFHAKEIPQKMIEGEIIMISKMNETGRKLGYDGCEYDIGDPPEKCTRKADFIIERGFPIQD